jgi:hypothetical protein
MECGQEVCQVQKAKEVNTDDAIGGQGDGGTRE